MALAVVAVGQEVEAWRAGGGCGMCDASNVVYVLMSSLCGLCPCNELVPWCPQVQNLVQEF